MQAKHHETMKIDNVVLRVKNLGKMKEFYTSSIGLTVLSETDSIVNLGVANATQPILVLDANDEYTLITGPKNGLYHIAILLPARRDLGDVLYRMILDKVPLTGASFHGYSEALYLQDPEDNGVEIYADLNDSEWDINAQNQVMGVTEAMDAQAVIDARSPERVDLMPAGTLMGHLHLSSDNVEEVAAFHQNILQLDMQMSFAGNVYFTSYDNYHHHFAANIWGAGQMVVYAENQTGLGAYTLRYDNAEVFAAVKENFAKSEIIVSEKDGEVVVTDPNGVLVKIILNK